MNSISLNNEITTLPFKKKKSFKIFKTCFEISITGSAISYEGV